MWFGMPWKLRNPVQQWWLPILTCYSIQSFKIWPKKSTRIKQEHWEFFKKSRRFLVFSSKWHTLVIPWHETPYPQDYDATHWTIKDFTCRDYGCGIEILWTLRCSALQLTDCFIYQSTNESTMSLALQFTYWYWCHPLLVHHHQTWNLWLDA